MPFWLTYAITAQKYIIITLFFKDSSHFVHKMWQTRPQYVHTYIVITTLTVIFTLQILIS
jgi:hypothetical protein